MLGALSVGKKAASYGYKKFGKPGAVVAGVGAAAGYAAVKRRAKSAAKDELTEDEQSAADAEGTTTDVDLSVDGPSSIDSDSDGGDSDSDSDTDSDSDSDASK